MSAAKAERRWFVTIVTPMKRGLKVVHVGFRGLHHLVTIVTPMKRGLKVVHVGFRGLHHLVTIVTPMKRGLKAIYAAANEAIATWEPRVNVVTIVTPMKRGLKAQIYRRRTKDWGLQPLPR